MLVADVGVIGAVITIYAPIMIRALAVGVYLGAKEKLASVACIGGIRLWLAVRRI